MKLGSKVLKFDRLESTSKLARELAEDGEPEGTLVVADVQTAGTGRLGRRWESPKGGLWFSMILRPPVPAAEVPKLTLLAGVAVAAALRGKYKLDVHLKWPNDVQFEGKKLAGTLSEARMGGEGEVKYVISGIGLNVDFPMSELSEGLQRTATTLREAFGKKVDPSSVMRTVISEFEGRYAAFCGGDGKTVIEEWKKLASTLGNKVKIETAQGTVSGVAEDIDISGALVVRTAKGLVTVSSGDVVQVG
jgi:BirA family biotin operon repressor/biotin-[acetyl-CoA-carboxylase] ligase